MKSVEIMLDPKKQETKPKNIGSISESIVKNRCTVTIEEFAKSVGEQGKTFMPCVVNGGRKKENYVRNQVYALDFDKDITPDEFLSIAEEYNIIPVFIYETFSSTEKQVKFRAVFVGDVINEYAEGAELVINMLFQIFPKADQQCKDLSRLFFGGKKLIYTNYEAEISIRDLAVAIQTMCQKRNKNCVNKVIDPIAKDLRIAISKNIFLIEEIDGNNFEDDFSAI